MRLRCPGQIVAVDPPPARSRVPPRLELIAHRLRHHLPVQLHAPHVAFTVKTSADSLHVDAPVAVGLNYGADVETGTGVDVADAVATGVGIGVTAPVASSAVAESYFISQPTVLPAAFTARIE